MQFQTFEEARRASLFRAAAQSTVVVKRNGMFWTLDEAELAPSEVVLGRATFAPAQV